MDMDMTLYLSMTGSDRGNISRINIRTSPEQQTTRLVIELEGCDSMGDCTFTFTEQFLFLGVGLNVVEGDLRVEQKAPVVLGKISDYVGGVKGNTGVCLDNKKRFFAIY